MSDHLLRLLKDLPDQSLWFASEYMQRLLQTKSTPKMDALVERFSAERFKDYDSGELKTIVQQFVALVEE